MHEAGYSPMMSDGADPCYGLAPTEPCWADILRPWGPTGTCHVPGNFALGLCEEHAYEIIGHPEGAK